MPAQDLIRMAFRPSDFQQLLTLVDDSDTIISHKLKAKWLEWKETHPDPSPPDPAPAKRTSKRASKQPAKVG
jgi:hypothetical protein